MDIPKMKTTKQIGLYIEPKLHRQVEAKRHYLEDVQGEKTTISKIIRDLLKMWVKDQVKIESSL